MELLLKHGASIQAVTEVNTPDCSFFRRCFIGNTISFVILEQALPLLKVHVNSEAKLNLFCAVSLQSGLTPIHVAAFMGHENIVHALTRHGASPNTTNVVSGL